MQANSKMLLVLALLIGTMYFWITMDEVANSAKHIIAMLMLVGISYWLGRLHQTKCDSYSLPKGSEINAGRDGEQEKGLSLNAQPSPGRLN